MQTHVSSYNAYKPNDSQLSHGKCYEFCVVELILTI